MDTPESSLENRLIFGDPDEWKDFAKRHAAFLERCPRLFEAVDTAFLRILSTSEGIEIFVYQFGRLCLEDFCEVLLCCGNGYGAGALKLLRSLYEKGVTLRYIHDNPTELSAFLDFMHVSHHKLLSQIEDTFGKGVFKETLVNQAKEKYEQVKRKFLVTVCKDCGTQRVNHTWSKLDFVSMAKRAGTLAPSIISSYYIPLMHAHPGVGSLSGRLDYTGGRMIFDSSAQRGLSDDALREAHLILLEVLKVQDERFHIPNLSRQLDRCGTEFMEIYTKPTNQSEESTSPPAPEL
jgi:hypothetical protein